MLLSVILTIVQCTIEGIVLGAVPVMILGTELGTSLEKQLGT